MLVLQLTVKLGTEETVIATTLFYSFIRRQGKVNKRRYVARAVPRPIELSVCASGKCGAKQCISRKAPYRPTVQSLVITFNCN